MGCRLQQGMGELKMVDVDMGIKCYSPVFMPMTGPCPMHRVSNMLSAVLEIGCGIEVK